MDSLNAFRSELGAEQAPPSTALATGLGIFSLALGAAEVVMPRLLQRAIGIEPTAASSVVTRVMGTREIVAGVGVLMQPHRPLPLWARVAGDAVGLALLGLAATRKHTNGLRLAAAVAAVGGITALDILASVKTQKQFDTANRPVIFSVTINKPPQEVYAFFRDFRRLPEFMDYLAEVREIDETRSHWVAKLPIGHVAWYAEITEDRPGELIAWQSSSDSTIQTRGRVTFAKTPGRNMTEVRVEMQLGIKHFGPSAALAKYFSKPQIKGDLRRLKMVMETGEVLKSDATVTTKPRPAQPATREVIDAGANHEPPIFIASPPTAVKGLTGEKGSAR